MEPFTIFLDTNDPRRSKLFWIFHFTMSVFWIYQGLNKPNPEWYGWTLAIGGILAVLMAIGYLIINNVYGRRKLTFNEKTLEVKVKQLGDAHQIPWQDIERISLHTNSVEVVQKSAQNNPLNIPLESYVIIQQAKKLFQEHATKHNIAIA